MPRVQAYACIVAGVLIVWGAVIGFMPRIDPKQRIVEDFRGVPMSINEWTGTNLQTDRLTLELLSTCTILDREYEGKSGDKVNLSIIYGRDLGDFHQPEACLRGAGWKAVDSRRVWVHPRGLPPHQATMIILRNDQQVEDIITLYWFYMAGQISPTMQKKVVALLEGFSRKGVQPSALVKFSTPITTDEAGARKLVIEFCEALQPSIIQTVSKKPRYEPSRLAIDRVPEEAE